MVQIMKKGNEKGLEYLSGGSLIHSSVVLTTAHNLKKPNINVSSISVRAADWKVRNELEKSTYQNSNVESIVIHEHYYAKMLWNDVSLLFLEKPFIISPNINPICLPPQDQRFDNRRCIVSGRSQNTYDVPIVSHQECKMSLDSTNMLSTHFRLHDSFICAGGEEGIDSCQGDVGSLLICPISNKEGYYYQAGIKSWGIGCETEGVPGVYVKISKFRNWIDRKLNDRDLSTDSYTN